MTEQAIGIGHNLSPEQIEYEKLADRTGDLVSNANRWKTDRPEIQNDDQASKAKEFIDQLRDAEKAVEQHRKKENQPHADAVKEINARHQRLTAVLSASRTVMTSILTPWVLKKQREAEEAAERQRAEAQRIREEAEAARKKAEQGSIQDQVVAEDMAKATEKAEKVAAEPPRARVTGNTGKATSLRTTYRGEIADFDKCLAHFKDRPQIREALQKIVDAEVRGKNHSIPGVEIKKNDPTVV